MSHIHNRYNTVCFNWTNQKMNKMELGHCTCYEWHRHDYRTIVAECQLVESKLLLLNKRYSKKFMNRARVNMIDIACYT